MRSRCISLRTAVFTTILPGGVHLSGHESELLTCSSTRESHSGPSCSLMSADHLTAHPGLCEGSSVRLQLAVARTDDDQSSCAQRFDRVGSA